MRTEQDTHLIRRPLDLALEPQEALRLLRNDTHPVALFGSWTGGSDIVASEPVSVKYPPSALADVLDGPGADEPSPARDLQRSAFGGGWIGYLGFGLTTELLPVPETTAGMNRLPAWWFGYYDHVLRRDQQTGAWVFEALWTPERDDALEVRFTELMRRARAAGTAPQRFRCGDFAMTPSPEHHRAAVRKAVDYIHRGDIFQANICLGLEAEFEGDPLDAFTTATSVLQPPYAAFLSVPGGAVASMSPELFLRRDGTTVLTRPIKGTTRRSSDPLTAADERARLMRSDKDGAENIMIVDLMRNDLSRVCVPGSVVVPRLLDAEAHPGLWHLVSDVRGTVRAGVGDGELLAATFPPGSVTGAPKVRALEIIHELEPTQREVYTGAIGYRSPVAGLELSVAIRTFEFAGGRVWLGSGGGITVRSDDIDEYRECLVKATPLITALGASLASRDAVTEPRGVMSKSFVPRPMNGIFTSVSVGGGRARDLDKHLARLAASAQTLYGKRLPASLRDEIQRLTDGGATGRLRITATPRGGPLQTTAELVPVKAEAAAVRLRPTILVGGLGPHKWRDRGLLAELTAGLATDEQTLIHDDDGELLETDKANIFAVIDHILHTPPADGRILPGITRAAVLELARAAGILVSEAPVFARQLDRASEIFVTNSVHGITPVLSVSEHPTTWVAGPIAARLTAQLESTDSASRVSAFASKDSTRFGKGRPAADRIRPVIVVIDNYDSFTYNLVHQLLLHDCQVEVVRNDETSAAEIALFGPDGIVISPGPCTPSEAGISVDTVRLCGPTIPILGVCLGHQAIAAAYGGEIVRAPVPVHGQASAITHDGLGLLAGMPQAFLAARYHSLLVSDESLPTCLNVTARTSSGLPMGIRHEQYAVEGVQFHPESIRTEGGGVIMGSFTRALRDNRCRPAVAS